MKKKLKNTLWLMLITSCCFVACNNDDDKDENKDKNENKYSYFVGSLEVDNGYTQDDVKVEFKNGDIEKTQTMTMLQVRFSDKMPVYIDMSLQDMQYQLQGNDTIYTYDEKVPYAMNSLMPQYTMKQLEIKVTKDSMYMQAYCGANTSEGNDMLLKYNAKRGETTK